MNKLTIERIQVQEPYKSIINLLLSFGKKDNKEGEIGLKPKQIIYCLTTKRNVNEDYEHFFSFKIKEGEKILTKSYKDIVKHDCLSAKKKDRQVYNCLKELKNYGWVDYIKKPRYHRYYLSEKFFYDSYYSNFEKIYKKRDSKLSLPDALFDKYFDNIDHSIFGNKSWILYGFSYNKLNKMDDQDKKILNESISNIEENLINIMKIKLKNNDEKELIKLSNENDENKRNLAIKNASSIGFIYELICTSEMKKLKNQMTPN